MIVELNKFQNRWYKPGSKIKILIWYYINIIFIINTLNPLSNVKVFLLRLFGAKIGKGVFIKPGVSVKYPWLLEIGNHVWIGENVWIDNLAKVTIKDNVCISQGAMLLCGNHNYKKTTFDLIVGEIHLAEGSWVGAQAVVCPGVKLESHAILSVGSIATNNLDTYCIYQGNPAIKIRERVINN